MLIFASDILLKICEISVEMKSKDFEIRGPFSGVGDPSAIRIKVVIILTPVCECIKV